MRKTTKQESELIKRLKQLYSDFRAYKKAQADPPAWMNTKALAAAIAEIEEEISNLEGQLDTFWTLK
jgi:septal ring factor EnvC (AmiA/AmiB activator)